MSISRFLFGDQDRMSQVSTQTGGQQQQLSNLLGQLSGGQTGQNYNSAQDYLSKILSGDKDAYNMFASPYLQNFEQQIVPQLAERFAGLGGGMGGGALGSSGFGQALGGAGAGLQSQLAGLFANLQQNAAGQATNQYNQLSGMGLGTRALENVYQPGSTGALGGALAGLGQGVGSGFGLGLGAKAFGSIFGGNKGQGKDSNRAGVQQQPGISTGPYDAQGTGYSYNPYTDYMGY